jgi:release factor glutamine methyltransferase
MTDIDYLKKYLPKEKLSAGLNKLKEGKPVQYIVGNVDFYDINLLVNKNVLIPRFETELLVQKTINYAQKIFKGPLNIIDLGTGSGAIAITLKKHLNSTVDAIDISSKALEIAQINAKKNNQKINFYLSDMLSNVKGKYDIVVSNPPYISKTEIIEKIVYDNEPHCALFAEENGLEYYHKILKNIKQHLKPRSLIAFEIGMNQNKEIIKLIKTYLPNANIVSEKDYTDKNRFIFIFNQ